MSSAPPPPPPPPGPPVMASTSKQSKKAGEGRSLLLTDIQKGTRLKSSKHLMNDRSGLVNAAAAANGKPSQNNGSGGVYGGSSGRNSVVGTAEGVGGGKTSRGPPNLGDLFAGGIPRLRSTASSSQLESPGAPDGPKRKSQTVRNISQEERPRLKSSEPPLTNSNANHVSNMSLRRVSTGTLIKPPIPGNKPALPGPKPSLSFSHRASTGIFTDADKPISESQPVAAQPVKPPPPPAKPSYMQNHSGKSQTLGRNCRPVSCAPSFSTSREATSFLNMAESPFAFPIPRPSAAEPAKTAKRSQNTASTAQTLNHVKNDHGRAYPRPTAVPPPLPKRETNGSSMSNSVEDATDYSSKAVSPSISPVKESSESRSQVRVRQNRSSVVAEQPSLSSSSMISYDTDFEGQFRFHRETELPPPDMFKNSHRAYPSKNPKNPANRGSFAVW